MNYELAKKLKEAGFPQKLGDLLRQVEYRGKKFTKLTEPTLEELIEACGEGFGMLIKYDNGWVAENNWRNIEKPTIWQKEGSTALEAVANLYIALHTTK